MPDQESFQVVVRFNEALGLPYKDGIEAELARALPGEWPAIAAKFPGLRFRRVFEVDNPKRAGVARNVAQRATQQVAQQADVNAPSPFFVVELPDARQAKELVRRLKQLGSANVKQAFVRGRPTAADGDDGEPVPLPPQDYLGPAPMGIDATAIWKMPGGRGEGVTILDLERGWDLGHEDLPPRIREKENMLFGENREDKGHGTSVLGILVGRHDRGRVKGVAPDARVLLASYIGPRGPDVAAAIHKARTKLQRGDILLLECVMSTFPGARYPMRKAPAEIDPDVLDEIQNCTAMGIVVVEPAGNDGKPLGKFELVQNHSGALMVGAAAHSKGGQHYGKRPACACNYGSRVDCFAWGHGIATLEEGGRYREFGSTSGAAAIIAGAAAMLQSIAKERRGQPLTPDEMRRFLCEHTTGTRNRDHGRYPIGVMPDMRKIVGRLDDHPWLLDDAMTPHWHAAVRKD